MNLKFSNPGFPLLGIRFMMWKRDVYQELKICWRQDWEMTTTLPSFDQENLVLVLLEQEAIILIWHQTSTLSTIKP